MTEADKLIGQKIKSCRQAAGMSQKDLALRLEIAWQQVQKYERGINRVTASRLWEIATILDVPVSCFFATDLEKHEETQAPVEQGMLVREVVKIYDSLDASDQERAFKAIREKQASHGPRGSKLVTTA